MNESQITILARVLFFLSHNCVSLQEVDKAKATDGPCEKSLEKVLQLHNIERQVYHGGAFIGNHVHRALEPTVVAEVCEAPVTVFAERNPAILGEARTVAKRYLDLLRAYAKCRSVFSRCSPVSEADITELAADIRKFLQLWRDEIVGRQRGHITPKFHLLEEHTVPLMKRVGVGLGLLAEQGAESLHSIFNSYDVVFKNIPVKLQIMKAVIDQHLVSCVTEMTSIRPRTRSNKRRAQQQN